MPKNYKLEYKVDNINVTENYSKDLNVYYYTLKYNDISFPFVLEKDYTSKRELIKKIDVVSTDDITCLNVTYKNVEYPICYDGKQLIDYHLLSADLIKKYYSNLISETDDSVKDTYNNVSIYNYNNNDYMLWNYKGYIYLNAEKNMLYNTFSDDNYDNDLSFQNGRYLIFPNYDSEYFFSKIYVYDFQSKKMRSISFDQSISYNSYFLGTINNKFYLVDRKSKIEYEINAKKLTIDEIGTADKDGKIYSKGWQSISLTKLINKDYTFTYNEIFNYSLEADTLYLTINSQKIKISDQNVSKIVYKDNDNVYYLVGDVLYQFNYQNGETKLLEYSEWNFNNQNMIYIYN